MSADAVVTAPVADRQRGIAPSLRRIRALIRRHAYLLLRSWPRIVSMAYYPTVTMVLWAFLTLYLKPTNRFLADAGQALDFDQRFCHIPLESRVRHEHQGNSASFLAAPLNDGRDADVEPAENS